MSWEYRVVPFTAFSKPGENRLQIAAAQFQGCLASNAVDGFEYYRMDHYSLYEPAGCVSALFGAKPAVVTYDVAVFRRQR